MPESIFGLRFDVSSRNEGVLDEIAKGLTEVQVASLRATRRALIPMVKSTNTMISSFAQAPASIKTISSGLAAMTDRTNVSASGFTNLTSALAQATKAGGPFAGVMSAVQRQVDAVSKSYVSNAAEQEKLQRRALSFKETLEGLLQTIIGIDPELRGTSRGLEQLYGRMAVPPKGEKALTLFYEMQAGLSRLAEVSPTAKVAFKGLVDTMGPLGEGLRGVTIPQLQNMMKLLSTLGRELGVSGKGSREFARSLGLTGREVSGLRVHLKTMVGILQETEAQARAAAAEALAPLAKQVDALIGSVATAPASFVKLRDAMVGMMEGGATAGKVSSLLAIATATAEDLAVRGYGQMSEFVKAMIPELERFHAELLNLEIGQRQVNKSIAAGIPRTKEQIDSLRVAQSAAHGFMMGSAILSGNLRSLAFSVVFLRFSIEKLTFQIAAITVAFGLLAKVVKGTFSLIVGTIKGGIRLVTGIVRGGIKTFGAILDGAYQVADKITKAMVKLVTEAARKIVAGLRTIGAALLEEGTKFDSLKAQIRGFVSSTAEAALGMQFFREQANLTGFTVEDLTAAWVELAKNFKVTPRLWKGVLDMAAANAKQAAESAAAFTKAVGKEKADLSSLWDWGIRVTEVQDKRLTLLGREAVKLDLLTRIENQFTGAIKEQASTYQSLISRLGSLRSSILELLATPLIRDFVIPVLRALVRLGTELYYLTKSVMDWVKKSGMWAWALQTWKKAIQDFMPTLRELWTGVKFVLVVALFLAIAAFRALGWIVGQVTKAVAGLWIWFKKWLQTCKPLWDVLRRMAQALKEMDWGAFLQGAKDFIANLPQSLQRALLAALAVLVGVLMVPLLALGAKIMGWLVKGLLTGGWDVAVGILFAGLLAALVVGIIKLSTHPDLRDAWFNLLTTIGEDFKGKRYLEAFKKIGGALLVALATGVVTAILPPDQRKEMTTGIVTGLNDAMKAITAGDLKEGIIILGGVIKDAIGPEWARVLIIGLAAALTTAFVSPALGAAVLVGLLLLLPSSEKLKAAFVPWVTDKFGKELGEALTAWFEAPTDIGTALNLGKATLTALLDGITAAINSPLGQKVITTIGGFFGQILDAAIDVLLVKKEGEEVSPIVKLGKALGEAIWTGFTAAWDILGPKAREMVIGWEKKLVEAIAEPTDKFIKMILDTFGSSKDYQEKGVEIVGGYQRGILEGWSGKSLLPFLQGIAATIGDLFSTDLKADEWGKSLFERYGAGAQSQLGVLLAEFKSAGTQIKEAIQSGAEGIVIRPTIDWPGTTPPGGRIVAAQRGGIFRRPTLALIAERGPEAVVPLRRERGGVSPVNVYITGNYILDDRTAGTLADKVGEQIVRKLNRRFQVGFIATS